MKQFLQKTSNNQGFTLVELIVYVGITSIVLISLISFSWNVSGSSTRIQVNNELTQNGRLVLEQITQKTQAADDIDTGNSTFDDDSGVLVLDYGGVNDVTFDTYNKNVTIGGQSTFITKIRMQVGANPAVDLTSDKIHVSKFYFQNYTQSTEAKNTHFELTMEYANPGDDPRRNQSFNFQTAISVREQ